MNHDAAPRSPDYITREEALGRFEQACLAANGPSLKTILAMVHADEQPILFPRLLKIELQHRLARGEHLRMSDYQKQFPDQLESIRLVFTRMKEAQRQVQQSAPHDQADADNRPAPENLTTAQLNSCPRCKKELPIDAPAGICPKCLLAAGMENFEGSETVNHMEASTLQPGPPQSVISLEEIGTDFGDYELLEELGRGGMGVVYRAHQKSLDREVAIKMLLAGTLADEQAIERFYVEAQAVGQLRHPNIVRVFEVSKHRGHHFFSMEYIHGQSLDELAHNRPLTAREAVAYVKTIAEAIHCAHEAGIIHRDLKPSNILTDAMAQPLIMDFGLAKRTEDESGITSTGKIMGTPSYMPPEQIRTGEQGIGPACDIYALGAILYDLLTGRPPFRGESSMDILMQVLEKDPVPPSALAPALDPDLETITLKCLEKDPAQRYSSAQALADELGRHLRGMAIQARPVTWMERSWRWCRRKPAAAASVALLAILLLVLSIGGPLTAWQQRVLRFEAANKAQTAEILQRETETLRQEAMDALDDARQQRTRAEDTSAAKSRQLYISDMRLAMRSWSEGDIPNVLGILDRHRIDTRADPSHRFEWNYLDRLCRTEIQTLTDHKYSVYSLAISPDGSRLASGGRDGIIIWELATRKPLHKITDVPLVFTLDFSPDGKQLAAGGSDLNDQHILNIWDTKTFGLIRTLPDYDSCGSVAWARIDYSPDGQLLAYPTKSRGVLVATLESGKIVAELKGFAKPAEHVSFSADGKHIVASSYYSPPTENIKIWDWKSGQEVLTLGVAGRISDVTFSPNGKWLAAAGNSPTTEKTVRIWKLEPDNQASFSQVLVGQNRRINSLRFSPDGNQLVAVGFSNQVAVWELNKTHPHRRFFGHQDYVSDAHFLPDGQRLISCSGDGSIKIWDYNQRQSTISLKGKGRGGYTAAFNSPGTQVALRSESLDIGIWEMETRKQLANLSGHQEAITSVMFSPAGKQLVSGSYDNTVRLWDLRSAKEISTFSDHKDDVLDVAFSPDGNLIASASVDGTARVWDVRNGRALSVFREHGKRLEALAFSPDGTQVASVGYDSVIRFWDPRTGVELSTLTPTQGHLFVSVAFRPDGSEIIAGDSDGRMIGWNMESQKETFNIEAHQDQLRDLSFTTDGARLASCSWDHVVKIWDTDTWQNIAILRDHVNHVNAVAFSPNGHWLVSEGSISQIRDGRPAAPR
jgi:WD40 repeat protein/predicted Ser/Thr protein kinase